MRQIYIDLTTDRTPVSAGSFIGYIGEHNATELLISIPQTMVDKSDYQVLVFQSGPMVFRSGHITENTDKATYRDGNTIHVLLSKSLTRVTALSVQVECYKEDFNGEASLVGKTQTVPNLMLKPSPDGFPAFGYDGSYEDVDKAIENSHKHSNLEVLHKLNINERGELTFDGCAIGGSVVKTYETPSQFPETETVGTMAFAENDDELIIENTTIESTKKYERIRLKYKPDIISFAVCKEFMERSSSDLKVGAVSGDYIFAHDDETFIGAYSVAHIDAAISIAIVTPSIYEMTKNAYGKNENYRYAESVLCLYNALSGFTIEGITEPLEVGWYRVIVKDGDFKINESYNLSCNSISSFEKISEDDPIFKPFYNVGIIPNQVCTNAELQNEFFSKVFEIVPPPIKRRGLYIFTINGWISLDDYIKSTTKIVNTYADLPEDCPVGTLAHVLYDGGQIESPTSSTVYKNNKYASIYFAPYPIHESFLFDFAIRGQYSEGSQSYKGFFDVETMLEYGLISVAISPRYDSSKTEIYNYSFTDQTLTMDGVTGTLSKGWNKVIFLPDGSVYIKPITNAAEVPFVESNPTPTTSPWGYTITDIQINGADATSLETYFLSPNVLVRNDNGAGLWVKTEECWVKTENPKEFLIKEITT